MSVQNFHAIRLIDISFWTRAMQLVCQKIRSPPHKAQIPTVTHPLVTTWSLFPGSIWFYCTKWPIHFNIKAICIPSVAKLVISLPQSSQPLELTYDLKVRQVIIPSRKPLSRDCWHSAMTHKHSCNPPHLAFCHSEVKEPHGRLFYFLWHSDPLSTPIRRESARKGEDLCVWKRGDTI